MKGDNKPLLRLMSGEEKRFIIPVYQRNYDWKNENCKKLYDDLIKIVEQDRSSHFFGSIVSAHNAEGHFLEFLVVDGQQRLTTVSLLLLAMYNLIEQGLIKPADATLKQRIYESYLVDKFAPEETRMKLKPVKSDQKAFKQLFYDVSDYITDSNLTINYNYFYDRIQKEEVSIDDLYFNAIKKLEIISIELGVKDNAQLIFESLNSTGLALDEGDKIRNFILMNLVPRIQDEYYDKYWNKIEVCTNYKVDYFVRDYLSIKTFSTPTFSKIYFTFKDYVENNQIEVETLLIELLSYAKLYEILLSGKGLTEKMQACIYRLNRLETTVTRPFFLEVLRLHKEEILEMNEVENIFGLIENYLFRRNICNAATASLNKIFITLHNAVLKLDGSTDDYLEKLKYVLATKKDRSRYPDDKEFSESISTREIYLMNSKNKVYLLERFENFGTKEDKNVWEHIDRGDYSIEHIMPQHLTPEWMDELGEDYVLIHDTWLHRLANLTLTAYNSKYSNRPFADKRDIKNGFRESGIRMNLKLAEKDKWNLSAIEERNEYMVKRALEIWNFPKTKYVPSEKPMDYVTLDDDISLKKRKIVKFTFKNMEQPVTSWIEMYLNVLQILHTKDKSILTKLAVTDDDNEILTKHIVSNKMGISEYDQIDEEIFTWTGTNTEYKISLLRRLFELFEENPSDLAFYLKDDEGFDESDEEPLLLTRRKYWSVALPQIANKHEDGFFSNLSPSKSNAASSYMGYQVCMIVCVANVESSRVELYLNGSKEKNKFVFDYLYKQKSDIEDKMRCELFWKRNDDNISSNIYVQRDGLGLYNESSWNKMVEFHATWSKKFYDVFQMYLEKM